MLDDRLVHQLKKAYQGLDSQGKLHSRAQLGTYYGNFRSRFGPERLRSLDGEELLSTMHDHGRRDDSLVYWLEFKDDEDFPALMTGSPHSQRQLTLAEAIQIARSHRDQLLRGVELLEQLPARGSDADYLRLQEQLQAQTVDVVGLPESVEARSRRESFARWLAFGH